MVLHSAANIDAANRIKVNRDNFQVHPPCLHPLSEATLGQAAEKVIFQKGSSCLINCDHFSSIETEYSYLGASIAQIIFSLDKPFQGGLRSPTPESLYHTSSGSQAWLSW